LKIVNRRPSNHFVNFGYIKKLVGLFEGEDIQALPEVAPCTQSYIIKANFNPSEVRVLSLLTGSKCLFFLRKVRSESTLLISITVSLALIANGECEFTDCLQRL